MTWEVGDDRDKQNTVCTTVNRPHGRRLLLLLLLCVCMCLCQHRQQQRSFLSLHPPPPWAVTTALADHLTHPLTCGQITRPGLDARVSIPHSPEPPSPSPLIPSLLSPAPSTAHQPPSAAYILQPAASSFQLTAPSSQLLVRGCSVGSHRASIDFWGRGALHCMSFINQSIPAPGPRREGSGFPDDMFQGTWSLGTGSLQ